MHLLDINYISAVSVGTKFRSNARSTDATMFSYRSIGRITLKSRFLSPCEATKNAKLSAHMIIRAYTPPTKKVAAPEVIVLRNNKIKFPTLRVVFKDRNTNENTHRVMSRNDALDLARDYALDLILGD